ncbi:hypothetical protein E1B28_007697 [Marasmius oreades]|uniref:C3H1-type domain-containing protein n=1 Tax=Marasmius oreades TaxID=181124 RepID=A0A9P7S2E8_9AGAR|nr:uncharacterized protein E1B28_007697 [Marasmius oreades]KAG7094077.1 hypothetical protein E1B28_007697 [Marasmius oreades]
MSSEAQLKSEIERLTATINKHKSSVSTQPTANPYRKNTYINPNLNPNNTYTRPTPGPSKLTSAYSQPPPFSTKPKEVVLNGVAFSSSRRSLVRKDLPKPTPTIPPSSSAVQSQYTRKSGHLVPASRAYKPHSSRGRRGAKNRNMTLTNGRRPYQARRINKKMKALNKQCPRFSTTGSCTHGLTCMYQHDPSKVAICWNFLQDNCPNSDDTCNLSHDPTPERTPLCLHFLNKGRCTRPICLFPHVNVGPRRGVCRDFAVLGYCEKGLDCDKQHVRECPDFAEKGACSTKGCKLPHVIRANRNRKPSSESAVATSTSTLSASSGSLTGTEGEDSILPLTANDAQLGDEYISLTFNESESEEDEDEDEEEDDDDEEDEGDDPDDVTDVPVVG